MRIAPAVVFAAFALSACTWLKGLEESTSTRAASLNCKKGGECRATVTVKDCAITVSADKIVVARDNQDVAIVWEIKGSPGATFAEDGIFFKPNSLEAARRQFKAVRSRSPERFEWRDANSAPGTFHYGVRVLDNGKACAPLDPIIINDI